MIKWIGQHIWDFISRFRNDVYLEDLSDPGSDTDKFLVVDANDKVGYRTGAEVLSDIGGGSGGIAFDGSTADGVLTYKDADEASVEANLTFSSETLSIGADDTGVANIVRAQRSSTGNGGDLVVSGGNPDSGETNKVGGDLALDGGKGTGSGAGGHVKIKTYAAGSSGTSFNISPTIWQFHDTGEFETPGAIELGHASDTTIARSAAGTVTIEGKQIVTAGAVNVSSGSQAPVGMQIARRTITTAEANNMDSVPIELIPAQGFKTIIVPSNGIIMVDRAATQTNSSADLNFHYESLEPGIFLQDSLVHIRRFMFNETGDRVYGIEQFAAEIGQNLTQSVNKAIEMSFDAATTTNCFTSIDVFMTYYVLDIS